MLVIPSFLNSPLFPQLQFTSGLSQYTGSGIKHGRPTVTLPEEKGLRELVNNKLTNKKGEKNLRRNSEASICLHASMPSTESNQGRRWDSIREFVYRESFIVSVDEYALKLFSFVFSTYNFYYWVSIFCFPDSLI